MGQHTLTLEQARAAVRAMKRNGSKRKAAAALGLSRNSFVNRLDRAEVLYGLTADNLDTFEVEPLPDRLLPVEDLVERRKKQYAQLSRAEEARKLINIRIRLNGPIGICHFGDPHVDDNGTDIAALERHTEIVRTTPGMFAGNVGDTTNNWVGRLARLYGEQSTSASEAWQLAEWFVRRVAWLYMIGGNHDCWSGSGDPLKWIMRQGPGLYEPHGVRLNLIFPNGREIRINARHDFAGNSQWNPAHGPMKAVQMGWRDHIATCGHKHLSAYGILKDPATGLISHAMRIASYKIYDRYAQEHGFPDQNISPACVTIINPESRTEIGLVQVFWDVEEAADYLKYKRKVA